MKKRLLCLLLVLVTALALCVSAAAAVQTGAQLNYVTDAAGLLREGERARLEKMAEAVSQKYRVGVYIVTVEDFRDYHADGVYKATYTIYHNYTMGEGPNRDGIMLLLSMDDRDWAMFCYGTALRVRIQQLWAGEAGKGLPRQFRRKRLVRRL